LSLRPANFPRPRRLRPAVLSVEAVTVPPEPSVRASPLTVPEVRAEERAVVKAVVRAEVREEVRAVVRAEVRAEVKAEARAEVPPRRAEEMLLLLIPRLPLPLKSRRLRLLVVMLQLRAEEVPPGMLLALRGPRGNDGDI
jgi:hypothetical protein